MSIVLMPLGKHPCSRGCASDNQRRHLTLRDCPLRNTLLQQFMMASLVRPTVLRQTCQAAASKRALRTKVSTGFSSSKPASSILRSQASRNAFATGALPGSMRVAAFHASCRRPILPPLPRKLNVLCQWWESILIYFPESIEGTGAFICSWNVKPILTSSSQRCCSRTIAESISWFLPLDVRALSLCGPHPSHHCTIRGRILEPDHRCYSLCSYSDPFTHRFWVNHHRLCPYQTTT